LSIRVKTTIVHQPLIAFPLYKITVTFVAVNQVIQELETSALLLVIEYFS